MNMPCINGGSLDDNFRKQNAIKIMVIQLSQTLTASDLTLIIISRTFRTVFLCEVKGRQRETERVFGLTVFSAIPI